MVAEQPPQIKNSTGVHAGGLSNNLLSMSVNEKPNETAPTNLDNSLVHDVYHSDTITPNSDSQFHYKSKAPPVQFTEERKLQAIAAAVSNSSLGVSEIANQFQVPRSTLYRWIKEEREKDFSKLRDSQPQVDISADRAGKVNTKNSRKLEIIMAAQHSGANVAEVAKQFDIPRSTLYRWIKDEIKIKESCPSKTYTENGIRGKKRKPGAKDCLYYPEEYYDMTRMISSTHFQNTLVKNSTIHPLMEALAAGEPVQEVSRRYGVSRASLYKWLKQQKDKGTLPLQIQQPMMRSNNKENLPTTKNYSMLEDELAAFVQGNDHGMNQMNPSYMTGGYHPQAPLIHLDQNRRTNLSVNHGKRNASNDTNKHCRQQEQYHCQIPGFRLPGTGQELPSSSQMMRLQTNSGEYYRDQNQQQFSRQQQMEMVMDDFSGFTYKI